MQGHWRRANGQPATREHLLMVLADLESVLLRASFSSAILRTSISNVVMETASESMLMANPVYDVEHCECPNGYEGTSCEVRTLCSDVIQMAGVIIFRGIL